MATSPDSVEAGSVDCATHLCDPCKYVGSDESAMSYCGQCNDYMCQACEKTHRGIKSTRNHTVITGQKLLATIRPNPPLPIAFCDSHRSNLITGFCESHKILTCDVCSSTAHRKCSKTSLRDKTNKMNKSQLDKLVSRMKQIREIVETLRLSRGKDADLLIKQAKKSVRDVQDDLEEKAYKAIEEAKKATESDLNDHLAACENVLKQVDKSIKEMQQCQATMNKEMVFIGLSKSSGIVEEIEEIATDVKLEATQYQLTFQPNKVIEDLLQQLTELGQVITTFQSSDASSGWNILEMTVSSKQDININTNYITASTFLLSGDLVLCHRNNKKLHLYSPTFTSKKNVDLPSEPWDVCTVADTEVVVTLPEQQKIQFVSVQPGLIFGKSLSIGRKCWGIDCHGGIMYVTCHNNPGNGEVLVMTMSGQIQRRLGLVQERYMFTYPDYVRVSRNSDRVYVPDWETNTVTCLTQHGDLIYKYTHKDLSHPRDIHLDSQDNILVSGCGSDNIHRVDKHGTHHSILVSKSDGVVGPCCFSYRDTDGALFVGMYNEPAGKVFWLKK